MDKRASDIPSTFAPPEAWPEYVHLALPRTLCDREPVGGSEAQGPTGIRWSLWPLTFEEYMSDAEPRVDARGKLARNRLMMWKRLRDAPVPKGWHKLSHRPWRVDGYVELRAGADYKAGWYKQARRDLRQWEARFLHNGYSIEPVSISEYGAAYAHSTVRRKVGMDPLEILQRKYATVIGREHMALWGVRNPKREVIAGICLRFSPTYKSATYECPFILPEAKKVYAMTALIDHWFKESIQRGASLLVFNSFWHPGRPRSWKTFSLFKSHFGPTYVAYPPTLWKFARGKIF